ANGSSGGGLMSGDGAFVVYQTLSTDLFGPSVADLNALGDLALFDVNGGTNLAVSMAAPDTPCLSAAGGSGLGTNLRARAISENGRYLVFGSAAFNLVAGQVMASVGHVFLTDRWAGTYSLVSHTAGAPAITGNGYALEPALSADGRWIAFTSAANDLVTGVSKVGPQTDVFLYDRLSGVNVFVSRKTGSLVSANGQSSEPVVSADGNWIAFTSTATDLLAGSDGNMVVDVFLYDRVADTVSLVSHHAGVPTTAANASSMNPSISAHGDVVVFSSSATDLTPSETGQALGSVYAYSRATGSITLISHTFGAPTQRANGSSVNAYVSGDGRWVSYSSYASDVVVGQADSNNSNDVFLWDRVANESTLASRMASNPSGSGNGESDSASLSDDGRFVAFSSRATNLVPAAGAGPSNIYLFDRASGTVRLVSATPAGHTASGFSYLPTISPDGSRVAFLSDAPDLVPGFAAPPFPTAQSFLFTRATGAVQLATGAAGSATAGSNTDAFGTGFASGALSADGSVLAFQSRATDLVPGDFNRALDVFAFRSEFLGPPAGFSPLTPCRVADTREASGPWGAPSLAANSSRSIVLAGRCGIPADAVAVSANMTVVNPTSDGSLSFSPAGFSSGGTPFLRFRAGQTRANNAILGLGASGATAVEVSASGPLDLVIDVNGYFK
ncbi:MAG: hypothetical protein NEA02_02535, partial [Thermoanaerobaculia bacterium]|nr:hypothetical protein [Thermoanaerobaculia bacterium]